MSIVSEQLQLGEEIDQNLAALYKGVHARLVHVNAQIREARVKAHKNNDWNHLDIQLTQLKAERKGHDQFLSQVRALSVSRDDNSTRKAAADQLLSTFRRG